MKKSFLLFATAVLIAILSLSLYITELYSMVERSNRRLIKLIDLMQLYAPPLNGWEVLKR